MPQLTICVHGGGGYPLFYKGREVNRGWFSNSRGRDLALAIILLILLWYIKSSFMKLRIKKVMMWDIGADTAFKTALKYSSTLQTWMKCRNRHNTHASRLTMNTMQRSEPENVWHYIGRALDILPGIVNRYCFGMGYEHGHQSAGQIDHSNHLWLSCFTIWLPRRLVYSVTDGR